MKKSYLVLMLLIVLVAGCVKNSGGSQTTAVVNGLSIVSLEVSPKEANLGEPVTLTYYIKNTGDKPIKNILVKLIAPQYVSSDSNTQTIDVLEPMDKQYGGTGEPYVGVFQLTAPTDAPYNQKITVPLIIRIYYDYSSSAVTQPITIYSKDEWKRRTARKEQIPIEPVSITNNDGPIQFSVENRVNPMIDPDSSNPRIPLIIHVINRGEGTPFLNGEENLMDGTVSVLSNAVKSIECKAGENTFYPSSNPTKVRLNFKLSRTGKQNFLCTLYFDKDRIQDINTFQLQFDFHYRYYITAQTSFDVWGNEAGSGKIKES